MALEKYTLPFQDPIKIILLYIQELNLILYLYVLFLENSDTSHTFSHNELFAMSKLLKNVARGLIEVAFPMSRSSSVPSTPEVLHLYRACLHCVRMLYTLDLRKKFCPLGFWTLDKIHIPPDLARKDYLSKKISSFYGSKEDGKNKCFV